MAQIDALCMTKTAEAILGGRTYPYRPYSGDPPRGETLVFPPPSPSNACHAGYVLFSSPEAAPFLVSTKNRDLWLGPVF